MSRFTNQFDQEGGDFGFTPAELYFWLGITNKVILGISAAGETLAVISGESITIRGITAAIGGLAVLSAIIERAKVEVVVRNLSDPDLREMLGF